MNLKKQRELWNRIHELISSMLRRNMEVSQKNEDKNNPGDEENYERTKKLEPIEISMRKLTKKIFELELLEGLAQQTAIKVKLKEKEVAEEKRKLDEFRYKNWGKKDAFCSKIWKFAEENDLYAIYNKYLDMPKRTRCKLTPLNAEQNPEVLKLRSEVDKLKQKLEKKKAHYKFLEEKVADAKIQLEIAESYREKDPEILRLIFDIDKYQDEVSTLQSKIQMINNKKLNNPSEDRKYDFVTASELILKNESKDKAKRSTFTVKTESAISRKLADMRNAARFIDKKPLSIKAEDLYP